MKASVNRGGFLGETTKPQADDIRRIQALYGTSTGVGVVTTLSEKTPDSQVEVFQGATMTSVEPVMVESVSEPEKTTMKPNLHKPSPPPPSPVLRMLPVLQIFLTSHHLSTEIPQSKPLKHPTKVLDQTLTNHPHH